MAVNKKGVFFTFAAIGLAIIIILSFNVYNEYRLKDQMEVIEIRVNTMNDFVKDLENDIGNAIFIVGFRSLLSLEDYMVIHNGFFNDVGHPPLTQAFDEIFREGITDNIELPLMKNNTFINWTTRMKAEANKTDISVDFTINSVSIDQTEPWMVDVTVDLDINIKDNKNTASWVINSRSYTKKINITGFVDPLYLVNNDEQINNTIRETPVADFSGAGLVTHLDIPNADMGGSYYRAHSDEPSYLGRFEPNPPASACCGIESLVNTPKLAAKGATTYAKTAVDYIYFDPTNNPSDDLIDGMETYPWFYLDYSDPTCDPTSGHVLFYDRVCDT